MTDKIPNPLDWTALPEPFEWYHKPLDWQARGLSQTASGYGRKLTSTRIVVLPDGRERRVYVTCFSNSGTAWINLDGARRIIRNYDGTEISGPKLPPAPLTRQTTEVWGAVMYKIVRHYFRPEFSNRVVKSGLTLQEAQAHCADPETSSTTATKYRGVKRTRERGPWFDGYTECNR